MKLKIKNIISLLPFLVLILLTFFILIINLPHPQKLLALKDGDFATFKFNKNLIRLEIAKSDHNQKIGLMNRIKLEENQGMIFVSEKEESKTFWMKDTLIPLDIIFLNSSLKVINFYSNTKPNQIYELYPSTSNSQYVIEMSGGWALKNNLKENSAIEYVNE